MEQQQQHKFETSSVQEDATQPQHAATGDLKKYLLRNGPDCQSEAHSDFRNSSEFVQSTDARNMPKVGQYCVDVKSFEERALPTLAQCEAMHIFVVDEIGKMEVFSSKFCTAIRRVFDSKNAVILATVPVAKGKSLQIVEEIKARPDCNLIMVTKANRDSLIDEVTEIVQQLHDAHSK
eukprot:Seg1311.6 transcript_id=Seg1311.6/GoldUCD/mRNA.D3Y31 product="Cancer-related nucleoside-triphosphatase" protein_id=Seg1311.6/GoldUCD/D3Y31